MSKLLWWRIVLAAVALEMLYGFYLVFVLGSAEIAYTVLGISSVFVFMAIGGFWIASKASWRPVLQAGLVGVAAVLFYTALTVSATLSGELPVTGAFLMNHLAKLLGAIAGGVLAAVVLRRRTSHS